MFAGKIPTPRLQDVTELISTVFFRHDGNLYTILIEHLVPILITIESVITDWPPRIHQFADCESQCSVHR